MLRWRSGRSWPASASSSGRGLHTGEVELRGDDVGGLAVHIAAPVMAAAGPGEILVSRTVRDLAAGADVTLEDRGRYLLKGRDGDWQLLAVARP
jgi:class 3 adenylate cyclase